MSSFCRGLSSKRSEEESGRGRSERGHQYRRARGFFLTQKRDDQRASARLKVKMRHVSFFFFFFRWKRCTLRSIDTNMLKAVLLLQEARLQKTIDNILFSHVRLIQTSFHDHSISAVESIPGLDVRARFVDAIDQQLDQLVVALLRRRD